MADNQVFDSRQAELLQLQREYRHMEVNRRAYSEESQTMLRKQQKSIEKLRNDNDMLRNNIATITRGSNRTLTVTQQQDIHRLHEIKEKYLSLIEQEKNEYQTMEEQIDEMRQKVLSQRKAMGGVNAIKENHHMIEKQIRILENRLDKALIKFNESIAHNKTLRDKIDNLRRERVVFENIYRKMERELGEKKKAMAEIIESSNHAYETRDTYQMEIAAIEQANRNEQEEFEQQMIELGRLLDTELALPLPNRNKHRSLSAKSLKDTTNSNLNLNGNVNVINISNSSSNLGVGTGTGSNCLLKNNVTMNADNIVIDGAALERVQNFEDAFAKIRSSTGITDVEELVRIFIKNEDHNFSLFNYVNEQNNEIEKCEEQIQAFREEEAKLTFASGDDVHHHKQVLRDLEMKLQSTESMADKYDMRCQDLQRTVEGVKRGVQAIYDSLGLSSSSSLLSSSLTTATNLLEDHSLGTLSESSLVNYLGTIEQITNKLIDSYMEVKPYLQTSTTNLDPSLDVSPSRSTLLAGTGLATTMSTIPTGPKVPMNHDIIHINPPKLEDYNSDGDEEDDEDESRPFTLEELKVRTLNQLQRKGQGGSGGMGGKQSKKKKNLQKAISGGRVLV